MMMMSRVGSGILLAFMFGFFVGFLVFDGSLLG